MEVTINTYGANETAHTTQHGFEPDELQQLFLPNSWACRNPPLKADHVLEHGSHLKALKSAPTTLALALLSASTTSRNAGGGKRESLKLLLQSPWISIVSSIVRPTLGRLGPEILVLFLRILLHGSRLRQLLHICHQLLEEGQQSGQALSLLLEL